MLSSVKTSVGKRPRHTHHLSTGSLPLAATERRDSCCDREWTPAATEKTSTRQAVTLKGPSVSERKRWRGAWPARERDLRGNLQDGKQRTPATQSAEPPARGRRGVSLRMRCMQPSAASTQTMPARPPETKASPPPPPATLRAECVPSAFRVFSAQSPRISFLSQRTPEPCLRTSSGPFGSRLSRTAPPHPPPTPTPHYAHPDLHPHPSPPPAERKIGTARGKGYASLAKNETELESLGEHFYEERLAADGWHLDEISDDDELDFALPQVRHAALAECFLPSPLSVPPLTPLTLSLTRSPSPSSFPPP